MTKNQKWFFLFTIAVLASIGLVAQQQFSGGAAQNITQFGGQNVAMAATGVMKVGVTDGTGTAITSTGAALDVNMKGGSIANTAFALNAGVAKVGIVYPYTGCGTTAVESKLAAMPTVATAVGAAADTCLISVYVQNSSTTTPYTVTITDNGGTVALLSAVTLNPLETRQYNFPHGVKLNGGLKWNASNAAVIGAIEGLQ